ncbi:MAG: Hsp20/alpha crystallin family protein [Gammaproteobacteria bacterium]|nr:Hsp20/alpha crystallin family protein [Gammaproteobacteria bacterium]
MSTEEKTEKNSVSREQGSPATVFKDWVDSFNNMERWFESKFPGHWRKRMHRDWPSWDDLTSSFEGFMPSVDVIDQQDQIVVRAELPGVDKDDIDIAVNGNTVTIKGSMQHDEEEEKGDFYRRETSSGSFSRTVVLPAAIDSSKVKAKFKNGVLKLKMQKQAESGSKKITVE